MENDFFECKSFVLQNVPSNYNPQNVRDYVEGNLDICVDKVITLPYIKNRVLVVIKETLPDFKLAAETIRREKLESQEIILSPACQMPAVIVTDIDFNFLEEEFLKMYLEVTFADCNDVITKCVPMPHFSAAVLHLANEHQEVVKRILKNEDHIPLPSKDYHIKISPFFKNFHDQIEIQIQDGDKKKDLKQENSRSETESFVQGKYKVSDEETHPISSDKHVMTDEESETYSSDEQKNDVKVTAEETHTNPSGEHVMTDEESETTSSKEQKKKNTSSIRGTTFRGRGGARTTDKNVPGKNNVKDTVTAEETHTNPSDEDVMTGEESETTSSDEEKKKNTSSIRGTTFRGRGGARTSKNVAGKNNVKDTVTAEETNTNSSDEHVMSDEESETISSDEQKKKNKSNIRGTTFRCRGGARTTDKKVPGKNNVKDTVTAKETHTSSSDEDVMTDEESETTSSDEEKKKNTSSIRGTTFRGRGGARTTDKNVPGKNNVKDTVTAEETNTNSSDEHVMSDEESETISSDEQKKKNTSSIRGTTFRGRGGARTTSKNVPGKNNVKDTVTAEETNTNSSDEHVMSDEESETISSDEQKKKNKSNIRGTTFRCRGGARTTDKKVPGKNNVKDTVTAKETHTSSSDEDVMTDEESETTSSDEEKKKNTSSIRGTTFRGRGGARTTDKNVPGKNNVKDTVTAEETNTNSSDEHVMSDEESETISSDEQKKKNTSSIRGTTFRGRGGARTTSKNVPGKNNVKDTVTAEETNTNSSDEHVMSDEESETISSDEQKKKNKSNIRGTTFRSRGGARTTDKKVPGKNNVKDTVTAKETHTSSSDEDVMTDEESETTSSDEQKKKNTSSIRGTTFRGRGGARTTSKNVAGKNNVKDTVTAEETHTNSSDENVITDEGQTHTNSRDEQKKKTTSSIRGTTVRGRGAARTKSEYDVRSEVTYKDTHINSSDEQKKQCDISSKRGAGIIRGRGRSNIPTVNATKNTSNSKTMIWNQDKSNDEVSGNVKDKSPVHFQSIRGRNIGRGCIKVNQGNQFEKSNCIPNPNEVTESSAKELSQKFEELKRKKQEISEENARLAVEIHKIPMTELEAKCLQPYMKSCNECEVFYDSGLKVAILKVPQFKMQECQTDFLLELKKVKEIDIPLKKDVLSILSSEKGQNFLQHLSESELKSVFMELDSNSLKVAALDEATLNEATKIIKEKVEYAEIMEGKSDIPLGEINILKLKIENQYKAKLNWDIHKAQLAIQGIKDDVLAARKEVEIFLEKYGVSEKSFDVGEPLAKYFSQFLEKDVKLILKPVIISDYSFTDRHISIRFKGNKMDTTQVLHQLEEMKSHLKILKWNLLEDFKAHEIFLIVNCFKYGNMKDIEVFMHKNTCLIDFSNLSSFQLLSPESSISHAKTKPKKAKLNESRPTTSVPENLRHADDLIYTVTNTCQIVIKDGDIVQEKSDILVSIVGTDLNLKKTRVGGSFNRACRSHWREVNSSHENNPNSLIVTVKNPKDLTCLAVCHIILEPWDTNVSPGKLTSALQEVLNEAKHLGAKSISIPALGCGATFKFPPSNVAQIMFQVFQAVNIGSFLQKVVLLAADSDLSKELNHEATKHFKCLKLTPKHNVVSSPVTDPEEESSDENSDDSEDDFFKIDDPSTNKNQSHTELAIMAMNEKIENLKGQIKTVLKEHFLFTKYFNQDHMKFWPRDSRQKIVEKAKELSVWVARSQHPKTKNIGFLIKGEKSVVDKMLASVQQEYMEISRSLPQKRLSSNSAPERGTLNFMQYASESDEHIPSYWSLNGSKSYWENIKSYWTNAQKRKHLIVDIDQETKDVIVNLVRKTFDRQLVKSDKAAEGLTHSSVKILNVQRVENVKLFEKYHDQRKTLFKKMLGIKKICPDIGKIQGSKGRVGTAKYLNEAMKKELFYEVNEHYLFYGTKNFEPIINFGLDPRNSSSDGLFGRGIYAAEISSVADVYTDSKDNRSPKGTPLTLILARVLLGNVFLCDHKNKHVADKGNKKLSRPPCMSCLEERCSCHKQTLFDSVMGDGHWLYRQFIIYDGNQIYPEYIITYERV
ncbi:hypothetical protein Btru_024550 [Bulinus truncatus]|nr:hypothetical protein Btru_024550 [Bulinus truncatus]